jgi:hypothetical protein
MHRKICFRRCIGYNKVKPLLKIKIFYDCVSTSFHLVKAVSPLSLQGGFSSIFMFRGETSDSPDRGSGRCGGFFYEVEIL